MLLLKLLDAKMVFSKPLLSGPLAELVA